MTCEEIRADLELYVAGALPRDDARRLEAHVFRCADCRAVLASFSVVTEALGRAAPASAPAPAMRLAILAQTMDAPVPVTAPRRVAWAGWLAAAALALLSLWLGYDRSRLRGEVTALGGELAEARAESESRQARLAGLAETADRHTRAVAVLTAPDVVRTDLRGQQPAPSAHARAFWSRERGMVFSASQLPALAPNRAYQLWVVTASAPVSVGLLTPDASGRVDAVFSTPRDLAPPVALAVTEEPAGGVPAPTGQKYLVGEQGGT